MIKLTMSELRKDIITASHCLDVLQDYKGKNFWINYVKVEEDLIYYNFGWEDTFTEDINFETIKYGLMTIREFVSYVKSLRKFIKTNFK